MVTRALLIMLTGLALGLSACGGGGTPGGPSTPPGNTYSVTAIVFYDQNGNGQLDGNEAVRLPQVEVVVGSASARSATGTGQAVVSGVAAGAQQVAIRTETLPVFFVPAAPISVQVPAGGEIRFPVQLPIGDNQPNVYMAFGDSLTVGVGSSDGNGYRIRLQSLLAAHLGRAEVVDQGRDGTFSRQGADRIPGRLNFSKPAYNLIHYGTNDWNDQSCQGAPPAACFTIDSLRIIVEETKAFRVLPVLATLVPVNPALNASRNVWVDQMNVFIKNLAREQGALLADLNAEFKAQGGDLSRFFVDDVHLNDAGYDVMARAWFKYLTQARSAAASSAAF
jgi:lysophospholipase L1-like esterase